MSLLLLLKNAAGATTSPYFYRSLLSRWWDSMEFVQSEGTNTRRRFPVFLVSGTDGLTAATGEAAGQTQLSKAGGAWTNTSATLSSLGNGGYYVELTAA